MRKGRKTKGKAKRRIKHHYEIFAKERDKQSHAEREHVNRTRSGREEKGGFGRDILHSKDSRRPMRVEERGQGDQECPAQLPQWKLVGCSKC